MPTVTNIHNNLRNDNWSVIFVQSLLLILNSLKSTSYFLFSILPNIFGIGKIPLVKFLKEPEKNWIIFQATESTSFLFGELVFVKNTVVKKYGCKNSMH
jgi:hypothetical protein